MNNTKEKWFDVTDIFMAIELKRPLFVNYTWWFERGNSEKELSFTICQN